ncbi:hypothetical protein ZWY2020_033649 [Hordeum vulgare]|nr:hypothetical protein ZWY2020_033649 [Hordeum vulgare]
MEAAAAMHQREREFYEVTIENKMMMYRLCRKIVNTSEGPKDAKWIFVLSTTKILYIGSKSKGTFQHSSFLAGGATSAAGRLVIANGILKAVWPHSGTTAHGGQLPGVHEISQEEERRSHGCEGSHDGHTSIDMTCSDFFYLLQCSGYSILCSLCMGMLTPSSRHQ